jgi:ribosomal protein S18 acetylase RimI-like enzyme
MSFTLYPALPSDAEVLIRDCDFPAMLDDPLRLLKFPRSGAAFSEEEIQWNLKALRVALKRPETKFFKACTGDGRPVGFAVWTVPVVEDQGKSAEATGGDDGEEVNGKKQNKELGKNGQEGEKRGDEELPKSLDIDAWLDATKQFKAEKERVLQGRKNLYRKPPLPQDGTQHLLFISVTNSFSPAGLNRISVTPAYQGKGVGSLLVDWGCEQADKTGSDMSLLASPAGIKLYEKFGFEVVGVVEIKGTKFTSMLRKARS